MRVFRDPSTPFVPGQTAVRWRFLCSLIVGLLVLHGGTPLLAQPATSPLQLKQKARTALEDIRTEDKKLQRIIAKAINEITRSLSDKGQPLFLDAFRIVPSKGEKVFERERKAVDQLRKGIKRRKTPADIKTVLQEVIDALVKADRGIAELSIATAQQLVQAGIGSSRKLAKAQREFGRALRALGETNPRKAIKRFKKAWESSQEVVEESELVIKSFEDSPDPFSPSLAINNTLSATFQIHQKGRFRKDDDRDEKHGRGDKDDDRGKKHDRDDDDDERDKRHSRRDDDRRSKYGRGDDNDDRDKRRDRDDKDNDRGKKHKQRGKNDDEKEQRRLLLEFVEIIQNSSNAIVRKLTTQHTIPHVPTKHKNRFVELTVTSVWDGKDDQGEIVPDGAYRYLAFGKLISHKHHKVKKSKRRRHYGGREDKDEDDKDKDKDDDDDDDKEHKNGDDERQRIEATSFPVLGSILLDNTPPVITATVTPEPNAQGWNNTDVTVSFDCTDATSGIATCPAPNIVTSEGDNQSVTGTASDLAGNTTNASVSVSLDNTSPSVQITSPANGATLNTSSISVTGTITETLSGVADVICNGVAASVSDSTFTCNVSLDEGANTLVAEATDLAGNVGTASIGVNVDTKPPVVTITAPANGSIVTDSPVTVSGTVDDDTATVLVNDLGATVSDGTFTVEVPLEEGTNTVTATATDAVGNVGTDSIEVTLEIVPVDTDPPSLLITKPAGGSFVIQNQPAIEVSYSDPSGVDTASLAFTSTFNGDPLTVVFDCELSNTGGRCTPTTALPEGSVTLVASVADLLGNTATTQVDFTVDSLPVEISISAPSDRLITKDAEIEVTGTVGADVTSVTINGVEATLGSPFSATVPLREGTNMVVAVATKASGKTGTDSIDVTRDIVAPIVRIESPRDGFVSVNNVIAVTGRVNDIVNGATDALVKVNGIEATVADGGFMVMDIPLVRGPNTIEAVATDAVGNVGRHVISVTFQPPVGARISVASGNGQFDTVMQPLPEPLVAVVKDDLGNPAAGRVVRFEVTRNSGILRINEGDEPKRIVQVPTDGSGRATVLFTLGDTSGEGNNRVRATAIGVAGEVEFCASALAAPPDKILMVSGDNQRGVVGNPLATPLEALVVDRDGNPIKDIPVTFTVISGDGNLNGQQSLERFTGTDGVVRAVLTLGPDPGINNNVVKATFPGLTGLPATFVASGLTPGDPAETRFRGVVLDNGHTPIPGAIVTIPNTIVSGITDGEGQFLLENVPVGHIVLRIDPTASPRPETFPALEFETVTVAGQTNILGQPILLPPLDTEGSKIVGGDVDVTLGMKGVAGLELTVFANSVTCPLRTPDRSPDGKQCRVTISQVHLDKVPMPPPRGTIFMPPTWTIQPAGVKFDPPAPITIPNNGLPPGRVIDIFQFDHTLNQFINVGKGTVSEDGSVVTSDPGFGITAAGWGGGGPPPTPATDNEGPKCPFPSGKKPVTGANPVPPPDRAKNETHGDGRYSADGAFRTKNNNPRPHYGVDLEAEEGTSVRATAGGKVEEITDTGDDNFGMAVWIRHDNGLISMYGHLSETTVTKGNEVEAGQEIGKSGKTGNARDTDAPHVHFEIRDPDEFGDGKWWRSCGSQANPGKACGDPTGCQE